MSDRPAATTVGALHPVPAIADGFWTVEDICTPALASACDAAGIG